MVNYFIPYKVDQFFFDRLIYRDNVLLQQVMRMIAKFMKMYSYDLSSQQVRREFLWDTGKVQGQLVAPKINKLNIFIFVNVFNRNIGWKSFFQGFGDDSSSIGFLLPKSRIHPPILSFGRNSFSQFPLSRSAIARR